MKGGIVKQCVSVCNGGKRLSKVQVESRHETSKFRFLLVVHLWSSGTLSLTHFLGLVNLTSGPTAGIAGGRSLFNQLAAAVECIRTISRVGYAGLRLIA